MPRSWWVNQSQSYRQEREAGILWAPDRSADGRRLFHWDTMAEVAPGDLILHYAKQGVRALGDATAAAIDAPRPADLPVGMWALEGRLVRVHYRDALVPVSRDELPLEWRQREGSRGPFGQSGAVKQGYLFELSSAFAEEFTARFHARFTPTVPRESATVPPEARDSATNLLRRLVGVPITTVIGEQNLILGVEPPLVRVATERAPNGRPVRISDVEVALARLVETGSVVIHKDEVGFRSAFVGAVLQTIPGTTVIGSPPVIRLLADPPDSDNASVTFEGDLTRIGVSYRRGEQAALRRRLFGSADVAQCALCGETFPVRFIVAAHIKPRNVCTEAERRDLSHVAMPACVFGCDQLFETGFVSVSVEGIVVGTSGLDPEAALARRVDSIAGRPCLAFTEGSRPYLTWHRDNIFRH